MANSKVELEIGKTYLVATTGFTYIKDWAAIKGTVQETGEQITVILGDKLSFGMRDMFTLKEANGIKATYTKDKIVNGTSYKQFRLDEILF